MSNEIEKAIERAVQFLEQDQQPNGSFLCRATEVIDNYDVSHDSPAIVPSNIVLSSLIHIPETPALLRIKRSVADFLLRERGEYWSYNYWFRNSPESVSVPYPDDLDDTFCALTALFEYDANIFDGEAMARIATMLASAEEQEGGPYEMFLVALGEREKWKKIDLVVNSNVAFFLSLQDIQLPGLDSFIDRSISNKEYSFPYCSDYPGLYFVSRFYKGERVEEMIEQILQARESNGSWDNPLYTALAVSALLNLSDCKALAEVADGVAYLLKTQTDGFWGPFSFFFEMKTPQKTVYAGSASITTALCIEALNKYTNALKSAANIPGTLDLKNEKEKIIQQSVVDLVRKRFSACGEIVRVIGINYSEKIVALDVDRQITLLPYFFSQSLHDKSLKIRDTFLIELGAAALHGWIAYTILDDFLDGSGDPNHLATALVSLRESVRIFDLLFPEYEEFVVFARKTFDTMDEANSWEVAHCRYEPGTLPNTILDFGDLSKLAERSAGHVLGPIAVLLSVGYTLESPEVQSTLSFFRQYLIARQLDDDAHDWEDDHNNGRLTWVIVHILKDKGVLSLSEMQTVFWNETVSIVSDTMFDYCAIARKELSSMAVFMDTRMFEKLLDPIEQSAKRALKEHKEILQFLSVYETRGKTPL